MISFLKLPSFFLFFSGVSSIMMWSLLHQDKIYGTNTHFIAGSLIILYFIIQSATSLENRRRMFKISQQDIETPPSISFAVIGYRENIEYWRSCLKSLQDSKYPNITGIYGFIDGHDNEDKYMKDVFDEIFHDPESSHTYQCILLPHGGKRNAMYEGFHFIRKTHPDNQYIIVIDSDTIVEPDATMKLVNSIHQDELIGCSTGTLHIFNQVNLLTKIINARYGYAFDIERSSMSFFGCMNCCSGPFSIYRQSILSDDLLEDFLHQKYCCIEVGPGDDRHLTNLVMLKGFHSVQNPFAIAHTESPTQFSRFLNQQLRWMRSFFREQLWQIRSISFQNFYLSVITTYEILFPFFILLGFFQKFFTPTPNSILIHRAIYGSIILFSRTLLLLWIKDFQPVYLLNLLYFPLYFLCILPIKLYAMISCYQMGWITSARSSILTNSRIETFIMSIVLCGWFSLIGFYIHSFILS